MVCQGLNGMDLGEKKLVVQRATTGGGDGGKRGSTSGGSLAGGMNALPISSSSSTQLLALAQAENQPSTVLLLMNMVTPQELVDDEEYLGKMGESLMLTYDFELELTKNNHSIIIRYHGGY